jgi:uncharacterized protein YggE
MKVVLGVLIMAGVVAGCTTVDARDEQYSEGFRVQGVGVVQAKPDIALLILGIEAQAPTAPEARTRAADALSKTLLVLREQGVQGEDIQTAQFVLRYGYGPTCEQSQPAVAPFPGAPVPAPTVDIGPFQACILSSLQARIRSLDRVDAIIDSVIGQAAPTVLISGIKFTVEKPQVAVEEARQMALADARKKAESQAKALGIRLGGVTSVSTSTQVPQFGYEFSGGRAISAPATGGGAPRTVEVVTGLFDLVVTANVVYDMR